MDHQGSSCILPSNAPLGFHDHSLPHRVLQEACGNRGPESDYGFPYVKAEHTLPSENGFCEPVRRHSRRDREPTEEEICVEAKRLWNRLHNCKQYEKYRSRQPKEVPPGQELKWPDNLEMAFCKGLFIFVEIATKPS